MFYLNGLILAVKNNCDVLFQHLIRLLVQNVFLLPPSQLVFFLSFTVLVIVRNAQPAQHVSRGCLCFICFGAHR